MGQMNVVPYIDVMLVLLIIFMITAPLMQQGVTVDLPETGAAPLDPDMLTENESLILSVDAAGNFYLNTGEDPEAPVSEDQVLNVTAAVLRVNGETPVIVNADQSVSYGRVMQGMALLQQGGAASISMLSDPVPVEEL
jgi:biopolymer transport protein TolR